MLSLRFDQFEAAPEATLDTDPLFARVKGDAESYVADRRATAATRLVKMSLIFKVTTGEALTKLDAKYLELWRNACRTGTSDRLVPSSEFDPAFAELNQEALKQLASFGFEFDPKFENFGVSELVFELAEMVNDELIDQFELGLQTKHIQETFAVDPAVIQLTKGYYSNRKKQLVDGVEETEWQKSQMFTQKDIDNILSLMKIGVGSQAKDTARWEKDRQSLLDFVESINHHEDRWELLFKCRFLSEQRAFKKRNRDEQENKHPSWTIDKI